MHLKNNGSSLDNDRSGSLSVDLNSDYLSKYVRFTFRDCNIILAVTMGSAKHCAIRA